MAEFKDSTQSKEYESYGYGDDAVRDLRRRIEVLEAKGISVNELPIQALARKLAIVSPTDVTGLGGASVSEGAIQDEAATSRKVALTTRHIWLPSGTSSQAITANTWTAITGLTYSVTPDTDSWLMASAQLTWSAADANWRNVYLRQTINPAAINPTGSQETIGAVHNGGVVSLGLTQIVMYELQGGGTYSVQMEGYHAAITGTALRQCHYTWMEGVLWAR